MTCLCEHDKSFEMVSVYFLCSFFFYCRCLHKLLKEENVCGDTGYYTALGTLYFLNYLFIYLFYMIIMIMVLSTVQTAMD